MPTTDTAAAGTAAGTAIDATAAREQHAAPPVAAPVGQVFRGKIAAGVCMACGYVNAVEDETRRTTRMRCAGPGCGVRVKLDYVVGKYNGGRPCNSDCQYAYGDDCSCACGGINHRAGYIAPPDMIPVWVRDRDRKRHTAKRDRAEAKETAKRVARVDRVAAGRAELFAAWPILAELETDRFADPTWHFIVSMRAALAAGDMSPRQIDASVTAIERTRERDARRAEADRVKAEAVAAGVSVKAGRQAIRGVIVGVKEVADKYSYVESYTTKITVACADGTRLFGTFPGDLEPAWSHEIADAYVGWGDRMKGQRVTFVATVEPSKDDPLFGYFKRPKVPADAPRLSHIGPDGQAPDAADMPTVAPQRPRKPRTAADPVPEVPAPEVTAEESLQDAFGAGELWARRLVAYGLICDTVTAAADPVADGPAARWYVNGRRDKGAPVVVDGQHGKAMIGANFDDPDRFDVDVFRGGKNVASAVFDGPGNLAAALEYGARAVDSADRVAPPRRVHVTVQPLPAARTAATVPAAVPAPVAVPVAVADVWATVVDVWAAVL